MSIKTMPAWKWALLFMASLALGLVLFFFRELPYYLPFPEWVQNAFFPLMAILMLALYALLVRWFEGAPAKDIPMKSCAAESAKGFGIGIALFTTIVAIMWITGLYLPSALNYQPLLLLYGLLAFLPGAVAEEIYFRGILFRWIDEKWGFTTAILVSAALFGLLHIVNPGASWWSSLAIAIEAGLMLAAAYKYSGTLWLPIGIHWAWNFTQGNIFGFAVSGTDAGAGLIQATVSGPDILTGGAFGAEASIITVVLGLALSAWFIFRRPACAQ